MHQDDTKQVIEWLICECIRTKKSGTLPLASDYTHMPNVASATFEDKTLSYRYAYTTSNKIILAQHSQWQRQPTLLVINMPQG